MGKILIPIAGCIVTALLLTSASFRHLDHHHKAGLAVIILIPCILVPLIVERWVRPKPAAPQPPARYPFGQR